VMSMHASLFVAPFVSFLLTSAYLRGRIVQPSLEDLIGSA
jgi:hypothetical protein